MSLFKCKMCGADLEISKGLSIAECEYCGTKQTVPKAMDENLQNLFNRANTLRIKSEFDKAERLYEKIIQSDSTQSDAYWGLILCKYGIEYVDDPVTFKKVPTCHRASYDSIIADDDYKSAIENADMSQRLIYEEQAKEIDRIQKEILSLAQKEENYDVFICYKETDANGQRTQDSVIANDIYYQLMQEGFKVFYAAITLEGKLGSAYEPIIFAALNSAKVMLAIGTKPEYFNAVWVKNEWSRYLKIIKNDRSKLLIPCYRDMDAYELPEEFAHLQAQDMTKIGFINDIVRGIQKVITKDEPKKVSEESTSYTPAPANIVPLLKRAFMFLEDGEWSKADDFCEQVLNQDPENAQAYLGKLMAELRVGTQEDLKNCAKPFDVLNNYKKVVRFADDNLKNAIVGYIEYINTKNENQRLESIYACAVKEMNEAESEEDYRSVASRFAEIVGYRNVPKLSQECLDKAEAARIIALEKAEEARKISIYNQAIELIKQDNIFSIESALKLFVSISDFQNVSLLIDSCHKRIEELTAQESERTRLEEIKRLEDAARAKRNKRVFIISCGLLTVALVFVNLLFTYIVPAIKYNKALSLVEREKYLEAIAVFVELDDYKDSKDTILECQYMYAIDCMEKEMYTDAIEVFTNLREYKDVEQKLNECYELEFLFNLKSIEVGDSLEMGDYKQTIDSKEAIEWIVLDVLDGKALLISKYALDCQKFNKAYTFGSWAECSLRNWMNNDFYNEAFSSFDKSLILTTELLTDADENTAGVATEDKVFLLSLDEINNYFKYDEARKCQSTSFARKQGVTSSTATCEWWLRSACTSKLKVFVVDIDGRVKDAGQYATNMSTAVRPAMWITIPE